MRKRILSGFWALLMVWSWGCKGEAPTADAAWYRIEAPAVTVRSGERTEAQVRFVPLQGHHWNEEFPAKVRLSELQKVLPDRTDFTSGGGDFRAEGGVGVLPIALSGQTAGSGRMRAVSDFSICNPKECRIFKGVVTELPVEVQ